MTEGNSQRRFRSSGRGIGPGTKAEDLCGLGDSGSLMRGKGVDSRHLFRGFMRGYREKKEKTFP